MNKSTVSEKFAMLFGGSMFMLQMLVAIAGTYLSFFLTDVCGMSAAGMGTILAAGGVLETTAILIDGALAQNTQLRWGKYRSWILLATPVAVIGYILMFINFQMTESAKVILLIVIYGITMIGINMANLGINGLASVVGETNAGRVKLISRQMQGGTLARLVSGGIFLSFVAWAGAGNTANGYLYYMLLFGTLAVIAYMLMFGVTKAYDVYNPNYKAEKAISKLSLGEMWRVLARNDQFLIYLISLLLVDVGTMISFSIMAYYYQYAVGNLAGMTLFLTTSSLTAFGGTLLGPIVLKLTSKKRLFLISVIAYAASFVIIYSHFLITGIVNPWVFLVVNNLGIVVFNFQGVFQTTMYMDVAEYGYQKHKKDAMPFILAFSSLPFQSSLAIGGAVVGFGLSAIGYHAGIPATPEFISNLMFLVAGVPAIIFVAACLFFGVCYKLTDERVNEIMQENKKAKAEILDSKEL